MDVSLQIVRVYVVGIGGIAGISLKGERLLKRIGLPEAGKLHTFRHSFISKALAIGIPNATVRA